jgi:myo-inositol-1(or 4)-monophosphatase
MARYDQLLGIAQNAARKAMQALSTMDNSSASYEYADDLPREMKSTVDNRLEEIIFGQLKPTGISILSEESGAHIGPNDNKLLWVVDPLDGTVNFIRGLAPCAVSIALWLGDIPVFGVISEYPTCRMAWGGRSFGAFIEGSPIHVSAIQKKSQAVLCTGFPSRFDFAGASVSNFWRMVSSYSKVRMLGAASLSLLQVARGTADAYFEDQIMLWDVAAGLAIIQGAGGNYSIDLGSMALSYRVGATNGILLETFD